MPRRILMLDPPGGELDRLTTALARACASADAIMHARDQAELLERLSLDGPWDLVVLDQDLGDGVASGLSVLDLVRQADADVPVVLVAETGDVESAARATARGANDLLVRGPRLSERVETQLGKLRRWLRLIDQNRALRLGESERYRIVGESPELMAAVRRARRVAPVPRPVLVLGERGTGKELIAREIHRHSKSEGSFVAVNCAAFAENLLEAELFGHERGAFTGAERRSLGKFELARGGTLFLDEIGHMSPSFQTKILRAVEYGTFLRVGGAAEVQVDTRVVAATNADLGAMIERGEFLPDLYDRLAFEEIRVPPLRGRAQDIELLARHFLERFVAEVPTLGDKELSERGLADLVAYSFPGNVRELKNIIERAVYRDTTERLDPVDLGLPTAPAPVSLDAGTFHDQVSQLERRLVERALGQAEGNQAEAARRLGLSYHQFRHYRKKHLG